MGFSLTNRPIRRFTKYLPIVPVVVVVGVCVIRWTNAHTQFSLGPTQPGIALSECPATPNCVCSQDASGPQAVLPFAVQGDTELAWGELRKMLAAMPSARLVREDDNYLRYEFRSRLFAFIDDVEFALDEPSRVIHVRSASRVGYSDLGANRRRVEMIRRQFRQATTAAAVMTPAD